jgi:DNA-binding transcriptional ArsR family regulator
MDVEKHSGVAVSRIAAAIGEPARARMLYCLMDGRARTSTELAIVADIGPSTASVHLNRLKTNHLVRVLNQGKYRYYSLEGPNVATVLEGLCLLAGGSRGRVLPSTSSHLRIARTCYDHMAGTVGVALHDRLKTLGWLSTDRDDAYELTPSGTQAFKDLGVEIETTRALRRRFAFACLDWSERRPHLGGALGADLLGVALKKKWVVRDLDSRALDVTKFGQREMLTRLGLRV